jgi:hypothetical protein
MALLVPNAGEVAMLEYILNQESPQNLTVRLYSNDITPDDDTLTADFVEVVNGGYANQTITPANWTITPGNPTAAVYDPELVFAFSGPPDVTTVYGYYVTRVGDSLTMWAERFTNGPFNVTVAGSEIRITLRFTANTAP